MRNHTAMLYDDHMLLQTKLYTPTTRGSLISRPRLLDKLSLGQRGKLTLVSAPTGFGKSTLAADWLQKNNHDFQAAWLSLDAADNEAMDFCRYLVAAVQKLDHRIGQALGPVLDAPGATTPISIVTAILNDVVALQKSMLLLLDDYHLINAEAIDEAMIFLIDHLPPHLHLVVLTRTEPAWPLARWRVRRELTEVRAEDLRFSSAEMAAFFHELMGLNVSPTQLAELEKRTEGWVASLQLAALSMQGHANLDAFITTFTGSHRHILDYLTEEVIQHQSPELRDFLFKTSILERLSAPLCDAILNNGRGGEIDSQARLVQLEQANLFLIPLDEQRIWYRYHHLFGELLQQGLQRWATEGEIACLHRRAGCWYEQQGQITDAIRHLVAGQGYDNAISLINREELHFENEYRFRTLLTWYASFPEDLFDLHPKLRLRYAHYLIKQEAFDVATEQLNKPSLRSRQDPELRGEQALLRGFIAVDHHQNMADAERYLAEAQALLPATSDFCGDVELLRAIIYREKGTHEKAATASRKAATLAEKTGRIGLAVEIYEFLAWLLWTELGRPLEAEETFKQTLALAEGQSWSATGDMHISLGHFYYIRNQLAQAQQHLLQGIDLLQKSGDPDVAISGLCRLAITYQAQGFPEKASAILQRGEEIIDTQPHQPATRRLLWQSQAHIYWLQDEYGPAQSCLQRLEESDQNSNDRRRGVYLWVRLLAAHQPGSAGLLDQAFFAEMTALLARAVETNDIDAQLFLRTPQALAHARIGEENAALAALEKALDLTEPRGFIRHFVDFGDPMRNLLKKAAAQALKPAYVAKLLAAFTPSQPDHDQQKLHTALPLTVTQSPVPPDIALSTSSWASLSPRAKGEVSNPLVESLTPREIETLGLIAQGLTNQAIAEHLVISIATVKRHISNLYGKLGVTYRTQAIARARDLQLM